MGMSSVQTWNLLVPRGAWRSGSPAELRPGMQLHHYGPTVAVELQMQGSPEEWLPRWQEWLAPYLGTNYSPAWLLAKPADKGRISEIRVARLPSSSWLVVSLNSDLNLPPGFSAERYTRFSLTQNKACDTWVRATATQPSRQQKLHILRPKRTVGV